jgi:hypothetical protein
MEMPSFLSFTYAAAAIIVPKMLVCFRGKAESVCKRLRIFCQAWANMHETNEKTNQSLLWRRAAQINGGL